IPGTVGGALRCNAGDRSGDIGQYVRSVEVLDARGEAQVRERDELHFAYRWSNLDDPVVLSAEFQLDADDPAAIVKRMRRAAGLRRGGPPPGFPAARPLLPRPPRARGAGPAREGRGGGGRGAGGARGGERR